MLKLILYVIIGGGLVYAGDQGYIPSEPEVLKTGVIYCGFFLISSGLLWPFYAKKKAKAVPYQEGSLDHVHGGGSAKQVFTAIQKAAKLCSDGFEKKHLELIKNSLKGLGLGDQKRMELNIVASGKRFPLLIKLMRSDYEKFSFSFSSTPAFCKKLSAATGAKSAMPEIASEKPRKKKTSASAEKPRKKASGSSSDQVKKKRRTTSSR